MVAQMIQDKYVIISQKMMNEYVLYTKKNEGIAATRQLGLDISKGNFIIYIDSDDYIEYDMIQKMYNKFTDDIDMVVCGYYTESSNITITNNVDTHYYPCDLLNSILEGKPMGALWNKW